MSNKNNKKRVALFGAAPDTPNMGVSALFMSTVTGLSKHIEDLEFVVFDNGLGLREEQLIINDQKSVKLIRYGARGGYRYYRSENIFSMLVSSKLGRLGAFLNKGVFLVDSCDAILDMSGGDSFSDIYGTDRFNNINRPKIIALNRSKPLILLPQTYGPYDSASVLKSAKKTISGSKMVWARDSRSFSVLEEIFEKELDQKKFRCGVDVAFSLEPSCARKMLSEKIQQWIKIKNENEPLLGINISGLIYNSPENSKSRYGFIADYQETVKLLINKILRETKGNIILVSHVMDRPGHYESDVDACKMVLDSLSPEYFSRIEIASASLDQSQVKWLISKLDWFCGTRMHSTIASLSSCVPTTTISYSDKAMGVFETCSQGEHVFDPRVLKTRQIVDKVFESIHQRNAIRVKLEKIMPLLIEKANSQLKNISSVITNKN